jgi:hypothetical protein
VTWLFAFFAIRTVRANVLEREDTRKGEMTMRSMLAMLLTLGIGITAAVPAALASDNAGPTCYANGVAYSCVQPARVTLNAGSNSGTVAGPTAPAQAPAFSGGDRN